MDLLDELGPQLRALTADQPAQPGDRVPGVTRRARGIRRTRMAVAAAAALAVVTPAALVFSSSGHHEATQYADLTTWPDRSQPSEVPGSDAAVSSFLDSHPGAYPSVRWLARRAVEMPNGRTAHVAVLVVERPGERWLVAGVRRDDLARSSQPAGWEEQAVPLPSGQEPDHVGLYLTHDVIDGGTPGFASMGVLIAAPDARSLRWSEQPLPNAEGGAARSGGRSSEDGVFVTDLGSLRGPVAVSIGDGPVTSWAPLLRVTALGAPELRRLTIDTPAAWAGTATGGAFQTEEGENATFSGPRYSTFGVEDGVRLRCYGGGQLLATVTGGGTPDATGQEPPLARVQVTCDGATQLVRQAGSSKAGPGASLDVTSDRLQSVVFVTGHAAR